MRTPFPAVEVDVVEGESVIEVVGDGDASMLLLIGDVAAVGGDNSWGSVNMLAARAGPDAIRSGEVKALVEWLAEPDLNLDFVSGRVVPPRPERLQPLLRLLRPGRYVMTTYVPDQRPHVVERRTAHWYDESESALIPTDHWPPRDHVTVRHHRTRIESKRSWPAVIELSPSPSSGIGYVLDGHHKLAAYQELNLSPLLIRLAPERPFRPRREEIVRATDVFSSMAWSAYDADRRDVRRLISTMSFLAEHGDISWSERT
jgi:hypothetical protein